METKVKKRTKFSLPKGLLAYDSSFNPEYLAPTISPYNK